ncbi:Rrf2 family transcriptional regulator [Lysobacter enzymogenes]|uniref:Transcriptional regulator, Rrf2 family n=1 Tax=Lysobacter enzymogenes TaxID=69 RepID=A0A0S2DHJ0_LYSEN|nr:Rrf2 family transcriptional regulator [Lysobacter enzymogenes]ALN57743.1 transcriptional regulator, Rrf2 family [Lysobacter enzymogenes]QCW26283.1 Rrf2 family transcriptional regulator [Lysobacter enzymogenes]QQP99133.1 Rrf2 family transcriptional regulator [Lysobacter enzymogenes]UZW58581.1 Rrf2 family transcriptional regulator [Lysobacter enzymogenes]
MKLSLYTDYSLRVLIHLGTHAGELASIAQVAQAYGISHSHLTKVVQDLAAAGFIETVRGRNGGIRLGRPAERIGLGEVVRHTEAHVDLVDCGGCLIAPACGLPPILGRAMRAFFEVLDGYTVADLLGKQRSLQRLFAAAG